MLKYNEIWGKFNSIINKKVDNEPVYNNKYLKTKIKRYDGKCTINFLYNEIPPKENTKIYMLSSCIDSVCKIGDNYYPLTLIEECKYPKKTSKNICW